MSEKAVSSIPPEYAGLIPHLVCSPCAEAIEFYRRAFDAEERFRMPAPDGRMLHAELVIGGRLLFLADEFAEYCSDGSKSPKTLGGTPVTIHRQVEDCDAAIRQAEAAGARVVMPAQDMFWGDRYGVIVDPFGHSWSFATHLRDLTPQEIAEGARACFEQVAEQSPG